MSILFTYPKFQAITSTGVPLSGGKLYTYVAGTSTDKATYNDRDLTTANTNPVVLDTRGEATVYLDRGAYKFVLNDSDDVLIWTMDDIYGGSELDNMIVSLGDIIQGGTSGIPERLAIGTEDQILIVGGEGQLIYGANGVSTIRLTNNSGVVLNAYDVVIVDTSADTSATKTTTQGDIKPVLVVADTTIAIDTEGLFYQMGKCTLAVQGNVARGDYLRTSATTGKAESAGSLPDVNGVFAVALTAYAAGGAGTVTAELLGHTVKGFTVGAIEPYGGATAPTTERKLLCDGTAISRTTYAVLYTVLSTTFGVGDGSTTFNIPDMRGRFPLGKSTAGTGSTLGGTGGTIDHVHAAGSHTHAHNHGLGAASTGTELAPSAVEPYLTSTDATVGSGNTDTGNPPFQAVNYLIRY